MSLLKTWSILLILPFVCHYVRSQPRHPRFTHYSAADGLSQEDVNHIAQDSRGFVWFGTYDGLNRFDGYTFKVFRPVYKNPNAIEGGVINSIIEDKNGMLWIGTDRAINRYDFRNERFEHFYVQLKQGDKFKVRYDPFYIDNQNELWFTYNFEDLGSINLETGKLRTYDFAHGLLQDFTSAGFQGMRPYQSLSKIYSVGADGLHIIDVTKQRVSYYFSSNAQNIIGQKTFIRQMVQSKDRTIWLAGRTGLISLDAATGKPHFYDSLKPLSAIALDKTGNIWYGGEGTGLAVMRQGGQKVIDHYLHTPAEPESLRGNTVNSLFIDRDGNTWAGIAADGIDKINPAYEQIARVNVIPMKDRPAHTGSVWSIAELSSDKILICSNRKDLYVYDKKTDRSSIIQLPHEDQNATIYSIITDETNKVWIGTDQGLLYSGDQMKTIHSAINADFSYDVDLFAYAQKILIGNSHGLYVFPARLSRCAVDTVHLFDNRGINAFGRSPGGLLGVATGNEFFLLGMPQGRPFVKLRRPVEFVIKSILFQDDHIAWFGTSGGLVRYDMVQNIFKLYTEREGLANNFVYVVLRGNDGCLWMSTNRGLSRFDLQTQKFTNYGLQEGAQSLEFNSHSSFQAKTGTVYFGGVNGFNYFVPANIKNFDFAPPIELLNISVNNNLQPLRQFLTENDPVRLNSGENSISVEFAAIDFNRTDNINYLYRLHSGDAWLAIGSSRSLNFANMAPDEYRLEVKAMNSNNMTSKHILRLAFSIQRPFYQSASFFCLGALLIILAGYRIYRYRIGQLLKVQYIRNTIARDLHDDIGSTLGSINVYSEVAVNRLEKEQPERVDEVLKKIGLSSREMIEKMNDIVWSISSGNDHFEELYHRMLAFAAMMLTSREITFDLSLDENLKKSQLDMQVRRNLFLIYKESIYNIVKYAECTKVKVALTKVGHRFRMLISDNGKGFDFRMAPASGGNGLRNMEARAKAIGGSLSVSSRMREGTKIQVDIMLK